MAIAIMKKVVLISEQSNKKVLLESLQELKGTEVIPFSEEFFEDGLFSTSPTIEDSELMHYHYKKTGDAIDFMNNYIPQLSLIKRMTKKKELYTFKELDQLVNSEKIAPLINHADAQRTRLIELDNELKELAEEERFLRQWQGVTFDPNVDHDFNYFSLVLGSIDNEDSTAFIDALKGETNEDILVSEVYITNDENGYLLIFAKEHDLVLDRLMREHEFLELDYPYDGLPKDVLNANQARRKQIIEEQDEIKKELRNSLDIFTQLQLANEYYANRIEREKANKLIMDSDHLFVLQGWMDADTVKDNIDNVKHRLGEDSFVYFTYDVEAEEVDEVPTKLKNNAFDSAFEGLTLQYDVPRYDEVDPTPFYSAFNVLFFGMMSADAGYGLLLFLGTLIPLRFFELSDSMRKNLKLFNFLSIGTIIVGLFFGSFFGFSLPFKIMDTNANVIEIMIISVALGLAHMLIGYGIKVYKALGQKDYADMYLSALMWILILLGAILMAINLGLGINSNALNNIGLFLILGNVLGMFIVNMITSGNPFIGFGKGLFGLIDIAGLVGDVVSYTRLMALAVSGANIAAAFNLILSLLPPIARFTVGLILFVALHALNIFISFLGAYVHSMRLQFVEFFGKFLDGGGKLFTPLRPIDKHVRVKSELER